MGSESCSDVPAPPNKDSYDTDGLVLYGVKLDKDDHTASIAAGDNRVQLQLLGKNGGPVASTSTVLAYGYAYEGHCYRFDKVRTFLVPGVGEKAVGCGFDDPPTVAAGYLMWRIRATTELFEVTAAYNTAQVLILDPNLPGRGTPATYAIAMQMAHRGGRLGRD